MLIIYMCYMHGCELFKHSIFSNFSKCFAKKKKNLVLTWKSMGKIFFIMIPVAGDIYSSIFN